MAKIHEEVIIIKLSTLTKEGSKLPELATDELLESLVSVAEELAGSGVVVESERA